MLQNLLRIIGIACILAGTVLYFTNSTNYSIQDDVGDIRLREEISDLQENLNRTKEELANLQIATSIAGEPIKNESIGEEPPSPSIIKTILRIESGTTSSTISHELERTGIIDDIAEFDLYLTTNDLSGKIQIGEYELDSSMSIKQIAREITNTN